MFEVKNKVIKMVLLPRIEPESWIPQTHVLSIKLQEPNIKRAI